jgi:hypothetical protein
VSIQKHECLLDRVRRKTGIELITSVYLTVRLPTCKGIAGCIRSECRKRTEEGRNCALSRLVERVLGGRFECADGIKPEGWCVVNQPGDPKPKTVAVVAIAPFSPAHNRNWMSLFVDTLIGKLCRLFRRPTVTWCWLERYDKTSESADNSGAQTEVHGLHQVMP